VKILFISNGLTHYYNLVLSRLNSEPGIELVAVVPKQCSSHIGEGVYQTKDGINFRVVELEESRKLYLYTTFKGLASLIRKERPDVVIVIDIYLFTFLLDVAVVVAMKLAQSKLILKTHPFRYPTYQEALVEIEKSSSEFKLLPKTINKLVCMFGLVRILRKGVLYLNRLALNMVDAHVNYIEAHKLWATYGVPREKIFVTMNSPDTDILFNVKKALKDIDSILPVNPYRILHVGRLVEWKRVDMLIRTVARLKTVFPDVELLVIGKGPEEAMLRQLAFELNLEKEIKFVGGVYEPRQLGQYFNASSLYVLAGMGGISINEAMCFGLPILCSICDGTEKILVREGVNGRYFKDGSEDDLFNKIKWFFEHPEKMKEMGCESIKIIEKDVNIRTVINGYRQALDYVEAK